MDDADQYRMQAEDARKTAGRSIRPEDKAFWLLLAQDWNRLAQEIDQREEDAGAWRGNSNG
jgi:hypothetical protein